MKSILQSYKGMFRKKYVKIYLLYMLFFMVDGPVQNMLPVLLEEKGQPARYYGYLLALINACCVVVPGLVSILSVKYNAYRVAAVAMIAAIVTGCMAFGVNQTYLLIAVLAMFLLVISLLLCIFQIAIYGDAKYGFYEKEYVKYEVTESLNMELSDVMSVTEYMMENTLLSGIYSCMEEFLWGCFWADCS